MNYRRGVIRLFIVAAAVWSLAWAWIYFDADRRALAYESEAAAAIKDMDRAKDAAVKAAAGIYVDQLLDGEEAELNRRELALWTGSGGLAGLVVLYLVGLWMWRGFSPNK